MSPPEWYFKLDSEGAAEAVSVERETKANIFSMMMLIKFDLTSRFFDGIFTQFIEE
jgi:hypothetical protein